MLKHDTFWHCPLRLYDLKESHKSGVRLPHPHRKKKKNNNKETPKFDLVGQSPTQINVKKSKIYMMLCFSIASLNSLSYGCHESSS